MKAKLLALVSLLIAGSGTVASANDASLTITADYVSEYVFRGVTLAGNAVQSGVEAQYGSWTLGGWASLPIGDTSEAFADEINAYAAMQWALGDAVNGEIGATLYHFPQIGGIFDFGNEDGDGSTVEIFGQMTFDKIFSPRLSAYYDLHRETVALIGGLSQPITIYSPLSIELGVDVGLVDSSVPGSLDYQFGKLSAFSFVDVTDNAAIYAGVNYGLNSKDTFSDLNFDIDDPDSIESPTDNSTWFQFGITSTF